MTATSIPKPLKARVNRLAHLLGSLAAEREKAALTARLRAVLAAGGLGAAEAALAAWELAPALSRMEVASQGVSVGGSASKPRAGGYMVAT